MYAKVQRVMHEREEAAREAARRADFAPLPPAAPPPALPMPASVRAERRRVALTQAAYLLLLLPLGITAIVAAILARRVAGEAPTSWLATHSQWQLRTFWTLLAFGLILAVLAGLLVGGARLAARMGDASTAGSGAGWLWLPAAALWLWVAFRVARGWLLLMRGETV